MFELSVEHLSDRSFIQRIVTGRAHDNLPIGYRTVAGPTCRNRQAPVCPGLGISPCEMRPAEIGNKGPRLLSHRWKMKSIYELYREVPEPFLPVHLADTAEGWPIELSFDDFYKHVHILGVSGKGKSRAIEYLLRQFLLNRTPFTLIDPHGSIYKPLVEWLAWQGQDFLADRTIHLFNPSDPEFVPGYNPLQTREGEHLADRVDWFMETMSQMLGGEDLELMQRYQLVFSAFIYALAEKGLTVADVLAFLPRNETDLRAHLSQRLGNRAIAAAWAEINSWTAREYTDFTGSFRNRMLRLLRSPVAERIFGQTRNCLDALEIMDQGQTLLCNLEPRKGFPPSSAKLLGRL